MQAQCLPIPPNYTVEIKPLSEEEIYSKCYKLLIRKVSNSKSAISNSLKSQITTGQITGAQACEYLIDQASFIDPEKTRRPKIQLKVRNQNQNWTVFEKKLL